ncbi:MAG TPA: hypothetical protein VMT60_03920, partial [Candidatus Bathyarchaeia archaeon]|nr:hypothetical protein [Candidatus Bathyarchaeia archaeon]
QLLRWAESRQEIDGRKSTADIASELNRLVAVLDVGLGEQLGVDGHTIFIQGMYCHGLSTVSKSGYWMDEWKTSEIALTAGIVF